MSTGTIILIIIMGWSLVIYGGITYLIVKKKNYNLISGFSSRPKEEQEYLINHGYIEATGKVMLWSFYLFAASFILALLPIPYGFEIGIALFIIVLMGGLIWAQKYEVPKKRKKMYWITGGITFATFAFVGVLMVLGFADNKVTITEDTLEISGMYSLEWSIDEIESVQLLDELPEVKVRSNGFASGGQLKGKFRLEEPYGSGNLYIKNKPGPYLYVATDSDYLILNRDSSEETRELYDQLSNLIK